MKKHLLLQKQARLDRAKAKLKATYIGIDSVIDEIFAAIGSWYLFPNLQDRPIVVNLWGLTGVGKTSLILNLAKELNLIEDLYHFDLGDADKHERQIQRAMESMLDHGNGRPNLIILDEFQHARTLESDSTERRHSESRAVWQLLDSGTLLVRPSYWDFKNASEVLAKLRQLAQSGIRIEKGHVIEGKVFYAKKLDLYSIYDDEAIEARDIPFVQPGMRGDLYGVMKQNFATQFDFEDHLNTLDGPSTIQFLEAGLADSMLPKTVDCTKSLVVVIGNLDEAYPMTHDMNPDLEADTFHELSKKITITQVKSALQLRFRSEQISRLGNMHIIYPAFNRKTFEGIITKELADISDRMWTLQRLRITYDESIPDILYKEGVFPTQGARPVLSTVHHMIRAKMSAIAVEAIIHGYRKCEVRLRYEPDIIHVDYLTSNGKVGRTLSIPQHLALEPLRRTTNDDKQAIVAVHEAGHAVAMILLKNWLPDIVISRTAESGSSGFVYAKDKLEYISRAQILNELGCLLAGFAAEKLVFGNEHVTTGSASDIADATVFINRMLKACGMGATVAAYDAKSPMTRWSLHDVDNQISTMAEDWLKQAMTLAEETLTQQRCLLLALANHLSNHNHIEKKALRQMVAEHAVDFDTSMIIEDGSRIYYQRRLQEQVELMGAKLI